MSSDELYISDGNEEGKIICFTKGDLLFIFNFHPTEVFFFNIINFIFINLNKFLLIILRVSDITKLAQDGYNN